MKLVKTVKALAVQVLRVLLHGRHELGTGNYPEDPDVWLSIPADHVLVNSLKVVTNVGRRRCCKN